MTIDIVLSLLAFTAVVIGVLGETTDFKTRKWKAVTGWGYAAILIGLLAATFMIVKSVIDDKANEQLKAELVAITGAVSNAKQAIVIASKEETSRLRPSDIDILLRVDYKAIPNLEPPEVISISGNLGDAFYQGELVDTKTPRSFLGMNRSSGWYGYRYYARNLIFSSLEKYPYLKSLQNKTFTARLDLQQFPRTTSKRFPYGILSMNLYIQGRRFSRLSEDGIVEIPIDFTRLSD